MDISIIDDGTVEGVEAFELLLTEEVDEPFVTISPERAVVSIVDDDCEFNHLLFYKTPSDYLFYSCCDWI